MTGKRYALILLLLLTSLAVRGQSLLGKLISVDMRNTRLADALRKIGDAGGFSFVYDSELIPRDSLVSITVSQKAAGVVLANLLGPKYTFTDEGNHVIILRAAGHLVLVNTDLTNDEHNYSVSGLVVDEQTGERLMNVSIYEKNYLAATLTDEHGYFRLRFRADAPATLTLTASKRFYRDTVLRLLHTVNVGLRNQETDFMNNRNPRNGVERTGLGRLFISARQKIQSLNIPDFFANRPFQISLTPGLSTHGMFSSQVVNHFSVNLAGGYTAGTNGLEFGGLFNINKQDAGYLQIAGIFNLVGGNVTGLQLAGAHNRALDTVKGAQVSLFINKAEEQVSGLQFSALHNATHRLKGVQIGLVNIADTSYGASIGLVNIIGNGFYKVAYSANNLANTNLTLKTGTHAFYSSVILSANPSAQDKFYALGLGIGHDFMFSNSVYLSAEADYHFANTGLWDDRWAQAKLLLNVQLAKHISVFGGATLNRYSYNGGLQGYQRRFYLPVDHYYLGINNPVQKWTGWEAGIAFNSVFRSAKKTVDNSQRWYLDVAGTAGIGWDAPYALVSGGELSLQRDLGDQLTGTLTTGYTHLGIKPGSVFTIQNNISVYDKPVNIIPVKAGIRLKAGKLFYFGGEVGEAFGTEPDISVNGTSAIYQNHQFRSLMYTISAGLSFNNGLETGVKFEDYGLKSQYKQFALRLGYRIRLGK